MTTNNFYEFYRNVITAQKQFLSDGQIPIKVETVHDEPVYSYVETCEYWNLNEKKRTLSLWIDLITTIIFGTNIQYMIFCAVFQIQQVLNHNTKVS